MDDQIERLQALEEKFQDQIDKVKPTLTVIRDMCDAVLEEGNDLETRADACNDLVNFFDPEDDSEVTLEVVLHIVNTLEEAHQITCPMW